GITFSVPFYGPNGKLKGSVSAIILTSALRDLLTEKNFALVNTGYQFSLPSSQSGQEFNRPNGLRKQCPIQGSSIRKLSRSPPMIRSSWALWVGKPDREFDTSLEVLDVLYIERVGYAVVVGVTYLVLAGWFLVQRHIKFIRKHEAETIFAANHDPLTRLPNRKAL